MTLLPDTLFNIETPASPLYKDILKAQGTDQFSLAKIAEVESATSSKKVGDFTVINQALHYKGLLWVPTKELRTKVLLHCHDHILAGHPGIAGTTALIRQEYTWIGMRKSVKEHLKHCLSCSRNKPSTTKPTGLLFPLKVPDAPWSSISVDFITDLPVSNGYDSIMVVVDRFTKWAEFFPCLKTITAQEASKIFLKEVFSRHGLPQEIVSDRGTQFVSKFFSCLTKIIGYQAVPFFCFSPPI